MSVTGTEPDGRLPVVEIAGPGQEGPIRIPGEHHHPALDHSDQLTGRLHGDGRTAFGAPLPPGRKRLLAIATPAVVLHRGALGEPGATLYAGIALFRHLAWGAVQLAIAAELAAALTERQGLAVGRPFWAAVFGAAVLLMVLAGPATVIKRWLVPSAVLTLLIGVVFAYSAWSDFGVPAMLTREAAGGWPGFTGAIDLTAAAALLWLPVAIDLEVD